MAQYIDKSALVAEIERLDEFYHLSKDAGGQAFIESLLSFLDTLEVNGVDLKAELNTWRHNHFHGRRDYEASGEYLGRITQLELARHFFELGLKAQKGEWGNKL